MQISLNNDVLIINCGVPLIFVVNKTDNPYPKYEDKSDFILRHVRKMQLTMGQLLFIHQLSLILILQSYMIIYFILY